MLYALLADPMDHRRMLAAPGPRPHAQPMFSVTEADAARIRAAFERGGEFSAAIELRRLFPGIGDNAEARRCARTIAGWKPLAVPLRPSECRDPSESGSRYAQAAALSPALPDRPGRVTEFGRLVAIRCPQEHAHIVRRAGGVWDPGTRRWLVQRYRVGPLIRALEAATDPLFRRVGMSLD
jgi:hypothetical protein